MFLAFHQPQDLPESLEGLPPATERHDVPFVEGDHPLPDHASRRYLEHQDLGITRLGMDSPSVEDLSGELEHASPALVLIHEELRIDQKAEPGRAVLLDAHAEGTFTLDESRKEPLGTLDPRESFLLIARTRHVVTMVNVASDVAMSSAGYSGVPAYSRIL
jgi:hypothetical protein